MRRITDDDYKSLGNWQITSTIDQSTGARHLSKWILRTKSQNPEAITFGDSAAALYVKRGSGTIAIGDQTFAVQAETGIYVAPEESFQFHPSSGQMIEVTATICPIGPTPQIAPHIQDASAVFDHSISPRVIKTNEDARTPMADRFYQVLVGGEESSLEVTVFIGEIPKSRAAFHRHLYEEAIVILSGSGTLWTENSAAYVKPGDTIFLPKKQLHSLECDSDGGMRLMGSFYPAGSPAINY